MAAIIDLNARFDPDLTKARKKRGPDSGLDWRGYNAANPTETQKDSKGRWTDNPVGRAIAQAFSNIRDRHPSTSEWVGLHDLRAEIGDRFPRADVDAELHRLRRGSDDEPRIRIIPTANMKALKPRDHDAALKIGDSWAHAVSFGDFTHLLPPPQRDDTFSPGPSPLSPSAEPWKANRARLLDQLGDLAGASFEDWSDEDLFKLRDRTETIASGVEGEFESRRNAAKLKREAAKVSAAKPRATARLKGPERHDPAALAVLLQGRSPSDAADKMDELKLNLADLRDLATHMKIKGRSKMRKAELRDAIAGVGVPDRPAAKAPGSSKPMRNQIIDAYDEIRGGRDLEWVSLTDLRRKLGGTREEQDAALKDLLADPSRAVHIIPEENQKTITDADRAAALQLSGENFHLIGFVNQKRPARAPEGTTRTARAARDTAAIAARIKALPPKGESLGKLDAELEGLSVADLRATADALGIRHLPARATGIQTRKAIKDRLSSRIDSEVILHGSWANRAPAALTGPPADIARQIGLLPVGSASLDEVNRVTAGMSVGDLKALRDELAALGHPVTPSARTKQQLRDTIAEGTIGFRQRAAAVGRTPGTGVDQSASLRHAEAQLAKLDADIERLKGRLGLAEDKRRRAHGGRIASREESKLRNQISELRRQRSSLASQLAPGGDDEGKA